MEPAVYADGALHREQKELIAVGTPVVKDCESCMQRHIEHAVTAGATFEEVFEAVEVAIELDGGRATVSARLALEVMDSLNLASRAGRFAWWGMLQLADARLRACFSPFSRPDYGSNRSQSSRGTVGHRSPRRPKMR